MVQPQTRARVFGFGLLMGVIFALWYQLVPVLGLLWLVALYRLRGAAVGLLLLGNALALILAGGSTGPSGAASCRPLLITSA
jgi:hypothetical protein